MSGDKEKAIKEVMERRRKIDAELEKLEQERNKLPYNSDSPFTKSIQIAAPPTHIPDLDVFYTFNGTQDPYHHVYKYEYLNQHFYRFDDATLCKLFPLTLKEAGYGWFRSLSSGSIESFSQLKNKFLIHFGTYNMKTTYSLMNIKQGATESLGSYIKRFEDATHGVANLDCQLAMTFLYRGLDVNMSKEFMEELILEKPDSVYEMYNIARRCSIHEADADDY